MAAILCQSCGSMCASLGQCLSFPCRLCGDACGACCTQLGRVLTSPFSPYLITTLALNVPPLVLGVKAFVDSSSQGGVRCTGDSWLWVNAALCLTHVLASFYIVNRMYQDVQDTTTDNPADEERPPATNPSSGEAQPASNSTSYQSMHDGSRHKASFFSAETFSGLFSQKRDNNNCSTSNQERGAFLRNDGDEGDANSWRRLKQVLCYDVVVAIYICVVIFWFVWQSIGISSALSNVGNDNNNSELCQDVQRWTATALTCAFVYMMLVCVAFSCSAFCLR